MPILPSRILIVEDHPIVRQGYSQLIESEPDLEVCGFATTELGAIKKIEATKPHMAVVDLGLEGGHGIELIKQVSGVVNMLVISGFDEAVFAERALEAGALGYINKQAALEKLVEGIRSVLVGNVFLSDQMMRRFVSRRVGKAEKNANTPSMQDLSDRELEVFQLLGQGLSTKVIANRLSLSPKTVDRYRENVKVKLKISDSTELIQRATQWVLERR